MKQTKPTNAGKNPRRPILAPRGGMFPPCGGRIRQKRKKTDGRKTTSK